MGSCRFHVLLDRMQPAIKNWADAYLEACHVQKRHATPRPVIIDDANRHTGTAALHAMLAFITTALLRVTAGASLYRGFSDVIFVA